MKIKLDADARMPERAFPTDAGLDLFSREETIILPGESAVFDTGVHVELPPGTFGKLESKSGLNVKYGVVSHGGVIDSGFVGSISVKLYNHGDKPYMIRKGDKIIQLIVQPCLYPDLELADTLSDTERGEGRFGSTGR
jgi:dUTP pyrophosphatase